MMRVIIITVMICACINTQAQIITTIAGSGAYGLGTTGSFGGDYSQATDAKLSVPVGVTTDTHGNIYVADYGNGRVRKIDTTGVITTIGGTGVAGYNGDGIPATNSELSASFYYLYFNNNVLYIPDFSNSRIRIIDSAGIMNTLSGDGNCGNSGNGGSASSAEVCAPAGIKLDRQGHLFLADGGGVIRKIDTNGIITCIAGKELGTFGYSGDGDSADSALFKVSVDLAIDLKGNIYISDLGNNKIRRIDTNGIITTFAGSDTAGGYMGDNGPSTAALLRGPEGIITDDIGNVFFSDCGNFVVRKIDTAGIITTIVGNGIEGFSGDNGPATAAKLDKPAGLAFDKKGNLYIADWWNNRIRKVSNVGTMTGVAEISALAPEIILYPNPAKNYLEVDGARGCSLMIYNVIGKKVKSFGVVSKKTETFDISQLENGVYFVEVVQMETGVRVVRKVMKE